MSPCLRQTPEKDGKGVHGDSGEKYFGAPTSELPGPVGWSDTSPIPNAGTERLSQVSGFEKSACVASIDAFCRHEPSLGLGSGNSSCCGGPRGVVRQQHGKPAGSGPGASLAGCYSGQERRQPAGEPGLVNVANTCYVNSVVQARIESLRQGVRLLFVVDSS